MNEAYSALSKVYEYLICDCDYEKWSQYLLERLKFYGCGEKGIDCACGSGFFTRALKRGGFNVTGVDCSLEMLEQAEILTGKEKLVIPYLKMDMTKLKSFEKVDFVTVINDGVNYVSNDKIPSFFKNVKSCLKKGGIFAFDFSSEYKIRNIIGNNLFGEDDENCSYLWFNKQGENFVDMDISVFIKDGDKYIKKEENHRQFIHKTNEIVNELANNGFEVVGISGHLGEKLTEKTDRIEIIAKKV